jgi:Uma2 family endonuclease
MGMVAATTKKHWTAAELRAIPDDRNRYEIIDGELLVSPSPSAPHQMLVTELLVRIHAYLDQRRIGVVVVSPADVELADDTVVQPDVFVAPLVGGRPPRTWKELGRLLLVIEVLSPSTARADRTVKRQRFQREGIPEYWIVDGDARVVERWRPEDVRPEILAEKLEWQPDPAFAPLVLDLPILFAETLGN